MRRERGSLLRTEPKRLGDVPLEACLVALLQRTECLHVFRHGEPVVHTSKDLGIGELELVLYCQKLRQQPRDLRILRTVHMEQEARLQDRLLGYPQRTGFHRSLFEGFR